MNDVAKRSGSDLLAYIGIAAGGVALGALAIGAIAVGRLAIGRVAVRRVRFRTVEVDDLIVRRLHVIEEPHAETMSSDEQPSAAAENGERHRGSRRFSP